MNSWRLSVSKLLFMPPSASSLLRCTRTSLSTNILQNNEGMSIPAFGEWDRKAPGTTKYSILFSQARANRKQQKTDACRSLGNEFDFTAFSLPQDHQDSLTAKGTQQKTRSLGCEQDFLDALLPHLQPVGQKDKDSFTNNANMFCPEPGGSGEKAVGAINNSMAWLRGRAHRRQRKTDGRCSLGNKQDLVDASSPYQQGNNNDRVMRQRWMSIPEFGGWEQKAPGSTNYSVVFSEARAIRKQKKSHVFRSLGNEQELVAAHRQHSHQDSSTSRYPLAHASIPEFGGWDRKAPGSEHYTMVFSQARAKRKQQKIDAWRSLGNKHDLDAASLPNQQPYRQDKPYSVSKRRKVLAYITCCVRPP